MKGVVKIGLALLTAAYLVVVLGFVDRRYEGVLCRGLDVLVRDSLERGLVTALDVRNMVTLEYPGIAGTPITELDVAGIEENLADIPAIADVQVYTDVQGHLRVEVTQRIPVARIEDRDHRHYYLDAQGYVIPATMEYTPHILHINGEIPGHFRKARDIHTADAPERERQLMEDILNMASYIQADPFWKSQIVQVYVNGQREFELVPRVGAQIILFGTADRMGTKFFKMKTLYTEGFNRTGWNQYEIINLKYRNQVICTKR